MTWSGKWIDRGAKQEWKIKNPFSPDHKPRLGILTSLKIKVFPKFRPYYWRTTHPMREEVPMLMYDVVVGLTRALLGTIHAKKHQRLVAFVCMTM